MADYETLKKQFIQASQNGNTAKIKQLQRQAQSNTGVMKQAEQMYINKNPSSRKAGHVQQITNMNTKAEVPKFDISDIKNQMNKSYEAQANAERERLKRLQEERTLSLNQRKGNVDLHYNQSIDKIKNNINDTEQNYHQARNAQGAINNQNILKLREAMTNMGLGSSGANASNLVELQNQHMANINDLTLQENKTIDDFRQQSNDLSAQRAKELSDIDAQLEQLKRSGMSEENEIMQRLEAQKANQLSDLMKYGDSRALQLYGMQQQQMNNDRDYLYRLNRDSVTDNRYNQEYQHKLDREKVQDDRYKNEWDYRANRDNIADDRYNTKWEHTLGREKVQDSQWQQSFDRQGVWHNQDINFREKQFNAEQTYKNQQLALARAKASSGGSKKYSSSTTDRPTQAWDMFKQQYSQSPEAAENWLKTNSASIKRSLGKETYDDMKKALGEARYKRMEIHYGNVKRANAFDYGY